MAKAILAFEQSKRADKVRSYRYDVEQKESPFPYPSPLRIAHRELRRMARRMAKMALKEKHRADDLRRDLTESYIRNQRLETEIDRLDPHGDK
jgi:hypothetical protein